MCRYSPATLISHVAGLVTYEHCLHNTSYKWINYIHPENVANVLLFMVNYYMYMASIITDRVPIWLLGDLQYSVTEN